MESEWKNKTSKGIVKDIKNFAEGNKYDWYKVFIPKSNPIKSKIFTTRIKVNMDEDDVNVRNTD